MKTSDDSAETGACDMPLTEETEAKHSWRRQFLEQIEPLCRPVNAAVLSEERLEQKTNQIQEAENAIIRLPNQIRLLKRYCIQTDGNGRRKLIKKPTKEGESFLQMISVNEAFEVMHRIHLELIHCGINKLWEEAKKRGYANITQETVTIFMPLCSVCSRSHHFQKTTPGNVPVMPKPPIRTREFGERGQVDTIDAGSIPHDGYRWIIRYHDQFTKFEVLRPAKTREIKEIAAILFEFLSVIGPPQILQSYSGRDFVLQVIGELKTYWPNLSMKSGRVSHPQSIASILEFNANFVKMVSEWCSRHGTTDWTKSLHAISFAKNCRPHNSLDMVSPYEATYCRLPPLVEAKASKMESETIKAEAESEMWQEEQETATDLTIQALQNRKRKHDEMAGKLELRQTQPENMGEAIIKNSQNHS